MTLPHKIVASPETIRRLLRSEPASEPSRAFEWLGKSRVAEWLSRSRVLGIGERVRRERERAGRISTFGRARWLSTGPSLEFATRARLRKFVTLEIDDSLA